MKHCLCGCGKEVKPGRRFIKGHHRRGHKHTEETKKKIGLVSKGRICSEETRERMSEGKKGHIVSEETRKKLSEINKGFKHPNFIHGKYSLLNQQQQHRKQECIFGCKNAKRYELHHEPELDYNNILEWEGKLVNLCRSCHKKVHDRTLELPDNVGIKWILKDTEKIIKEDYK